MLRTWQLSSFLYCFSLIPPPYIASSSALEGTSKVRVIYIDIDSLRPDHMGCYGYPRSTTPNIDRLAAQGTRFTQCFASDSPCMPSRAATLSGTFGITNGVVTHGERGMLLRRQHETLPYVLRRHHIPSVAISSFGRHPSPWFYVGWNECIDPLGRTSFGTLAGLGFQQITGEEIIDQAITWITAHQHLEDCYVYIQLWDPHSYYEAPLSFVESVRNKHYPEHPSAEEIETHQQDRVWHSAPAMGITSYDDWRNLVDEYDAEIRYADYQIGRLFEFLQALGWYEQATVLISADHGEELGEHGSYAEHGNVYNGTQHIPLIVRAPQGERAEPVSDELVYQMDIAATICEALDITPPTHWESQSLFSQKPPHPYLVCGHGLYTAQRAVVTPEWKLIRTFDSGLWEIPPVQLFRMDDRWEQADVAEAFPQQVARLEGLLHEWEEEHRVGDDPMMINVAKGPQGLNYARKWTQQFRIDGKAMSYVLPQRKPDPQY
jgi:choline-sulfatase